MFLLSITPELRKHVELGEPERVNDLAKRFADNKPRFNVLVERYRAMIGPGASFSTNR